MHFRVRKNVVQLIRTHYDPKTKGPKAEVVGKVPLVSGELSPELDDKLTPAEKEQYQAWLEHNQRTILLQEEMAARTLADTLAAANRWFLRQDQLERHQWIAEKILPELATLRRTIKRGLE